MYCNNCGSKIKEGSKFCNNCGEKVELEDEQNEYSATVDDWHLVNSDKIKDNKIERQKKFDDDEETNKVKKTSKKKDKPKKKGRFLKIIRKLPKKVKLIIVLVIVGVIAAVALFGGKKLMHKIETLDFGIKDQEELVLQQSHETEMASEEFDRKFPGTNLHIPFTTSKKTFSIEGEVLAAIDYEKIEYDINDTNKTITVTLPHAEIYKCYEKQGSFKVYHYDESIFRDITPDEQQQLKDSMLDKIRENAINNGILDKADEHAKNVIENKIKSYEKMKDYDVKFNFK